MTAKIDFDKRPEHQRWMQAAARVFTKTDRILSGKPNLQVATPDDGPAPAWTDGTTVSLRGQDFTTDWDTDEATARLMGLNYHEMVHVLYTPRDSHPGAILVRNEGLGRIFNAAEDQRGETLFVATYRRAGLYFTQAVLDLIISDGSQADGTWLLIAGRRYLPQKLRDLSRAAYRGDADEWQALVDRYLVVDWDRDPQGAVDILLEMDAHLNRHQIEAPDGCGTPVPTKGTTTDATKARDKVQDEIDTDQDEPEEDADAEDTEGDQGTDTDQDEPEEDADAEDTEGEPGQGESEDDEPEDEDDTAPGAGGENPEPELDLEDLAEEMDLEDLAEELADEIAEELAKDGRATESEIRSEMERSDVPLGEDFPRMDERVMATEAAKALAGDLEAVLSELRAEVDPGWASHQARGRINTGRYMQRQAWQPMDELFDEWQEGHEEALDIEIALLVDYSSSMEGTPAHRVAEVAWAMKRALQAGGIAMAVLGYDSSTTTVYTDADEADAEWMPRPVARHSTLPQAALMEVGRHFNYSPHRRRILVTLTDGAFWNSYRERGQHLDISDIVQAIDAEVRVLLRYGFDAEETWGFDKVATIRDIDQVADAIRETIVDGVREALRQ